MGKSRKSAQGLSLNTMIIGIIVLIVLMVLVGAFGGFFGNRFNPGFSEATEKTCENIKPECDDATEQEVFGNFGKDFPTDQRCCKKVAVLCEEDGICSDSCTIDKPELDKNDAGLKYVCSDSKKICCKK